MRERAAAQRKAQEKKYPPLETITRPMLETDEAAHYLNRTPGRLRDWQWTGKGPVRALKVGDRLGWPTSQIKALVGIAKQS